MTFAKMFPRDADYDMADPATYLDEEDIGTQQAAQALAEQRHRAVGNDRALIDEAQEINNPTPREPLQVPPSPDDIRSRYFAGRNGPPPQEQMPQAQAAPQAESKGFDIQRGLMAMLHGADGIRAVDSSRAQKAQTKLAQEKHDFDKQDRGFALEEQKRRAALLRQASDPGSEVSASMREELLMGFGVIGDSMPNLKPTLDAMSQKIGSMSATDMISMQQRMGGIFNMARQAAHDKATEAMAKRKLEDSEANTAALRGQRAQEFAFRKTEADEKRTEREEARDEKDTAAYGKEVAPIDDALFNADDAIEAKKKVSTGKIQNLVHEVRKTVGIPNKDMVELESAAGALGAGIRHAISGGAVTPDEGKYLLKQLNELDQSDAEYEIKLRKIKDRLIRSKNAIKDAHPRATKKPGAAPDKSKSKAREWLENNPSHPLAADVRKKLEGL
jgi:hypothetical protein